MGCELGQGGERSNYDFSCRRAELETVPSGGWVKITGSRRVVLSADFTPGLAMTIPSPHATLTFDEEQAQT